MKQLALNQLKQLYIFKNYTSFPVAAWYATDPWSHKKRLRCDISSPTNEHSGNLFLDFPRIKPGFVLCRMKRLWDEVCLVQDQILMDGHTQ